jgi:hypothetical protein
MTRRDLLKASAILLPGLALPQRPPKEFEGEVEFARIAKLAKDYKWQTIDVSVLVGVIGIQLINTPYKAGTLDAFDVETCSVDFGGMDCVTFYETCLAMARIVKRGVVTQAALKTELQKLRYRGGILRNYASRLHYTSDWFQDNDSRKNIVDITNDLGGAIRLTKKIEFMSKNPSKYENLKDDPAMVKLIEVTERQLTAQPRIYIPKARIAEAEKRLKTGDIIGICTNVAGLDCAHTGLIYRDEGGLPRFLHASSKYGYVTLDKPLSEFLGPSHTGIIAARARNL